MKALLLPVKRIENAKQRLAPLLSPAARQALMTAMMTDLFAAARAATAPDRVFVVTADPTAAALATTLGWTVLHETTQTSETASVDAASRHCESLGITTLLRLPLDLPLVTAADIDAIFAAAPDKPGTVLVPSRDGSGTNAILRTPPTLFPSHFGPDSYTKHVAEAEHTNATIIHLRNPRIEMDVDDEADLAALHSHAPIGGATGAWLESHKRASGGKGPAAS